MDAGVFISRYLMPQDIAVARELQRAGKKRVRITALKKQPRTVAGLDVSYRGSHARGAASLYSYPDLEHLEDAEAEVDITFPYVPGFLTFREGPALVRALARLSTRPDMLVFDGQGIAHPQGMGVASHLGALLNIPSIGCAKNRLVGTYREPGTEKGRRTRLAYRGRRVGVVLRTRSSLKPLFVSPGHGIDIESAADMVLHLCRRYRIPEPLRRAHRMAGNWKTSSSE